MGIVRRPHRTGIDGFADRPWITLESQFMASTERVPLHTTTMHLLQAGVPFNVIAWWLAHESPMTSHRYVEADLAMKEKALGRLEAPDARIRRYQAPDSLLRFLQTL
ncbi:MULTISPECIES: hypothetical protein [Paraburkholderia]|uniref:hypothetical protein n=1 Tax=Paraburkholderia TaxID=1822464 RepID=UPI0003A41132|nr:MULTISPECIES: hypothetical protein [Paraburkholderia]MDH6147572.1 hypothetical protein [Paraburkholderia sp. WSM4179]